MERPGKRVQEIPEDPREQLKLALQEKVDKIEINNVVYTFKPKAYGLLAVYVEDNENHIGYYDAVLKSFHAGTGMYFQNLKHQIGITGDYEIRIDDDNGIIALIFPTVGKRKEISEQFPNLSNEDNKIYIHDSNLVERLKNVVKIYYQPFLALLHVFEPSFKNVQFRVSNNLTLIDPNGEDLAFIEFKQFPSLNKLAWKKLTPEKQREFNIYAPNECRICQKPTEVMCSLTRIPFCSKECQMKYF